MLENIFERELKLPFTFVPDFGDKSAAHNFYEPKNRNMKFINWLAERDVGIAHSERFLLSPDSNVSKMACLPIHIDVVLPEQSDHIVKINFIYSKEPSYMNWYKLKPGTPLNPDPTPVNSAYIPISRENAELIYTVKTDRPRLVNAGIPHDIYPPVTAERYSFSFILKRISTQQKLSWDEAIDIFSDCIV